MKVSRNGRKNILIVVLAISVVLLAFNGQIQMFAGPLHVPPKLSVNVNYSFELADGAGASGSSGNVITDIGDAYVRGLIGNSGQMNTTAYNSTSYIALGNSTNGGSTYTNTKLATEATTNGFARTAALTPTLASGTGIGNGNYYNFTVSNKFTCATAGMTINGTSLQWSGVSNSDNNMFAEATIGTLPTGQAFAVGDNCTITWTITFQH